MYWREGYEVYKKFREIYSGAEAKRAQIIFDITIINIITLNLLQNYALDHLLSLLI